MSSQFTHCTKWGYVAVKTKLFVCFDSLGSKFHPTLTIIMRRLSILCVCALWLLYRQDLYSFLVLFFLLYTVLKICRYFFGCGGWLIKFTRTQNICFFFLGQSFYWKLLVGLILNLNAIFWICVDFSYCFVLMSQSLEWRLLLLLLVKEIM